MKKLYLYHKQNLFIKAFCENLGFFGLYSLIYLYAKSLFNKNMICTTSFIQFDRKYRSPKKCSNNYVIEALNL